MKTNAVNTVRQVPKSLWQKVKRPALIAAVALPTMLATQSCGPLFFFPWCCPPPAVPCCPPVGPYCPAVVPMPVPVPVPIYAPPVSYYGPCCDTTSVETAQKKMDILG